MSTDLEQRLRGHLHRRVDAAPEHDPGAITAVRTRARHRTWSARALVAAGGLAIIALAGSVLATTNEPSALITASDPTPVANDHLAETEPDESGAKNAPGTPAALPPLRNQILPDGDGGFVSMGARTADGIVKFVRSTNGEDWFWAHEWQLPEGQFVDSMRWIDGNYVALIDRVYRSNPGAGLSLDPRLAVSSDLITWEFIDLGLNDGRPPLDQIPKYAIADIAINDDDVLAMVWAQSTIDHGALGVDERNVCGGSETSAEVVLVLCDGSMLTVDNSALESYSTPSRSLLLSEGFAPAQPFTDLDRERDEPDGFGYSPGYLDVYPDGQGFAGKWVGADLARSASPENPHVLAFAIGGDGESVAIVDAGESLITELSRPGEDPAPGRLPPEVVVDDTAPLIGHVLTSGPAGWAAIIRNAAMAGVFIERDGWRLWRFGNSVSATMVAVDQSEWLHFDAQSATVPPGVQLSVFGGARYFRPGTDEVLLELTADELARGRPPIDEAETFDRTVMTDGWTIGGNPLAGPLTLTSPTGEVRQFADGFAFDNDDVSDGVETDLSATAIPTYELRRARAPVRFYDDAGNVLVEFSARKLFSEMVLPLVGDPDGDGGYDEHRPRDSVDFETWVVYSSDGVNWEVVWNDMGSAPFAYSVVVGDDELLIASFREITRIPLDDS